MSQQKRDQVQAFHRPETQKGMKSFLGLVQQFRPHLRGYETYGHVLSDMTKGYDKRKDKQLLWSDEAILAFERLQQEVITCPPLFFRDNTSPIFLHTDASNYGIGAYLFQMVPDEQGNPQEQIVAILSKTLTGAQLNWSTIEKEAYAIFYAFQKWEYLLRDTHFTLRTDHKNLTFMNLDHREKVKRWKLAIQHFDFSIEHIPGVDNIVADGLSRWCALPTEPTAYINAIASMDDLHMIPPTIYNQIKQHHNGTVGHLGVDKTIARLAKADMSWPTLRSDVKTFIKRCPACQKMSQLKHHIHMNPFTTASYGAMDRVAIDSIGPFPSDDNDNRYIIVIIDAFSRWSMLVPTKDATAKSAAQALLQWFGFFGIPSNIVSDNGSQYVNSLITEFLNELRINHIRINAYSHEENAIVERANKEVTRHLRAILYEKKVKRQWGQALPLVQRIMNAQVHTTLGVSPAQILFGNAVDLDRNLFNIPPTRREIPLDDYLTELLTLQEHLIQIALQHQLTTDQFHLAARQPTEQHTEFPSNSYVLSAYEGDEHRPPTKLHTRWRGPFRVLETDTSDDRIVNVIHPVTNKIETIHKKLLRPFLYDAQHTDPDEVAQHDDDFEVIERVLEHRYVRDGLIIPDGTRGKLSELQLLVKYQNDNNSIWQEWSISTKLNHASAVHEYLRTHKMSRFIPAQYKVRNNE
jgi:transposase InsO family protein